MPFRTTLAAAALVAALAAPSAFGAPTPAATDTPVARTAQNPLRAFDLRISGRQRVTWQYVSEFWGEDERFWRHGTGRQLASYRTVTPMRVSAGDYRRMPRHDALRGMPRLTLDGITRHPRIEATVDRISVVTDHSPPAACEGCGDRPSRTAQLPQQCGRRTMKVAFDYTGFRYRDGKLALIPRIVPGSRPFRHCAPDAGIVLMGSAESLLGDGMFWVGGIRVDAIFDLPRRGSLTFRASDDYLDGKCRLPSPPRPDEFAMCYWNDVTVTFTRVR